MSDKRHSQSKNRVKTGRKYEELAAQYFIERGYEIVEQNWHDGHREIDLIISKDTKLIFVEVKSVRTASFGHPAERVDKRKTTNLIKAAQQYLIKNNIQEIDVQFDVVTFINGQLEHFPNAFPADDS